MYDRLRERETEIDEGYGRMLPEIIHPSNYLLRMPDGTVKQMNPFTGTEVWTVPGRGHRPLGNHAKSGARSTPPSTTRTAPSAASGCWRRRRKRRAWSAPATAGRR